MDPKVLGVIAPVFLNQGSYVSLLPLRDLPRNGFKSVDHKKKGLGGLFCHSLSPKTVNHKVYATKTLEFKLPELQNSEP